MAVFGTAAYADEQKALNGLLNAATAAGYNLDADIGPFQAATAILASMLVDSLPLADGTVSAPSLSNSGDSNTGLYFSTADTVDVAAGGVQALTVTATGPKVISPLCTLGYTTGAGGAVTQITNSATGVTLSKPCGQITTVALTTAAAAEERFTVTNTLVAATDTIVLGTTYDGAGTPMLSVQKVAAGAFDIVITNVHAANALNAVMVINFAVVKGVAA